MFDSLREYKVGVVDKTKAFSETDKEISCVLFIRFYERYMGISQGDNA